MTAAMFLTILTVCAAITSLLTEGIKKFLDGQGKAYASNILVLIVAMVVGCGTTVLYYVNYQIAFNALNSVYIILMGAANWLGATLGYDKVKQTIVQLDMKENKKT